MKILITGGAGYIGSHCFAALAGSGHEAVILDNFDNASPVVIDRLSQLFQRPVRCVRGDIRDMALVQTTIEQNAIDAVIHFAGLKSVAESQVEPLRYFEVNVGGTERLLSAMRQVGCNKLIFSSSATVYGAPQYLPIDEGHPLAADNVYGRTKLMVEDMLRALYAADPQWSIVMLRYFNPIGAHQSALIGEDPNGIPNNLMPALSQVAIGRLPHLNIYGDDYDTPDGTGIRDYIHVTDLAEGHIQALNLLNEPRCLPINLGAGKGHSVLEVIAAFEKASGRNIPLNYAPRRAGDDPSRYADAARAKALLGWNAVKTLDDMCRDSWAWQQANPDGYVSDAHK